MSRTIDVENIPVSSAPVPDELLVDLADVMRGLWRNASRDFHLPQGAERPKRQQYWVLGALEQGPLRMRELAERACTSQASITGVVDRLETLGFVTRTRSDSDRRVVEVALTPAGATEIESLRQRVAERMRVLTEPLSPEETRDLLALLRKVSRSENSCGSRGR